jgi:tRNA pseudouridine32 synthase / 23S rRNA pseudouridine746 synthase
MTDARPHFTLKQAVRADDPKVAVDFLAQHAGLSKAAVKDAMNKGAAWLVRQGTRRMRRADTALRVGDQVELHYDQQLLALKAAPGRCLLSNAHYSLWFKPSGLLAQGTAFGDHCSLLRQVEKNMRDDGKTPHLIHRLDREAAGIMLFAHTRSAAAKLSALFQANQVNKRYRIQVSGDLAQQHGAQGRIDLPLDGKVAVTEYNVTAYDAATDIATVEIRLLTGRLHQIRRHLDALGCPVVGDPKYGRGNKNRDGMRLVATGLGFTCPFSHQPVEVTLEETDIGF